MALFTHALSLVAPGLVLPANEEGGGFHPPSIAEFFPDAVLFEGTPFEMNRIMLIRVLMTIVVLLVFWLGTRNLKVVPGRFQSIIEIAVDFVRNGIAYDLLGEKDGKRFLPLLTSIFFIVLAFNITGIIPGLNIAASSVVGLPLLLALVAYVARQSASKIVSRSAD